MKKLSFTKTKLAVLLATSVAVMGASSLAKADTVIYSDTLKGNANVPSDGSASTFDPLNGSAPDTTNTGGAHWDADGGWQRIAAGTGYGSGFSAATGDSAYLSFTVDPSAAVGTSYVLQATYLPNQQTDYSGGVQLGFTSSASHGLNFNGFYTPINGVANGQAVLSTGSAYAKPDFAQYHTGSDYPVTANYPHVSDGVSTLTVDATLSLTAGGWTVDYKGLDNTTNSLVFDSGVLALTNDEVASIADVGFVTTNGATLITNFSLTEVGAAVPEPSTYALLVGGVAALGALQLRRRNQVS